MPLGTTIPAFNLWARTLLYIMYSLILIGSFIPLGGEPNLEFMLRKESDPMTCFLTLEISSIPPMISLQRLFISSFYLGKVNKSAI